MIIRTAQKEDIEALLDIYNYEVINSTATFDLNEKTLEQWTQWFYAHNVDNHPLIVAELEGVVAGYASLSPYREKEAYKSTVELSVYVSKEYRGRGVATALMQEIIRMAKEDKNIHTVVSVITSENRVSERLHDKMGFTFCGTIHQVGEKFGRYLDISNFELQV
ncbi:MAG: N-acetyltransferase [Ruminococcaceae bacterium]|nr:N-acetyltransferase [Oscillospiraceae bacterium]